MCAATLSGAALHSKFRGSVIGALLGDCLGAPFETDIRISKRILSNYLKNLMSGGISFHNFSLLEHIPGSV